MIWNHANCEESGLLNAIPGHGNEEDAKGTGETDANGKGREDQNGGKATIEKEPKIVEKKNVQKNENNKIYRWRISHC